MHIETVQVALPDLEDVSASWVCRNNVLDREERVRDQGSGSGSDMPKSSTKRMKKTEGTKEKTKKPRPSSLACLGVEIFQKFGRDTLVWRHGSSYCFCFQALGFQSNQLRCHGHRNTPSPPLNQSLQFSMSVVSNHTSTVVTHLTEV